MAKELPETILRRAVKNGMAGSWELTWHEDRTVSPGVPDISFVMFGGSYETGWLELKAIDETEKDWHFKLQPSQPGWFDRHAHRIPVFILVSVGVRCWLLLATKYPMLQAKTTEQALNEACLTKFTFQEMRARLTPILIEHTRRGSCGKDL